MNNAFTLDELVALERRGWDSLCQSRGGDFYGALMTADAVMVLVNGMTLDRETIRASLDDAPPWESYEITEPRLLPIADGASALVYRARAERTGDDKPFEALMSSVYADVGGQPRLVLYQQTTVTH